MGRILPGIHWACQIFPSPLIGRDSQWLRMTQDDSRMSQNEGERGGMRGEGQGAKGEGGYFSVDFILANS